jgi:hypothetical protein
MCGLRECLDPLSSSTGTLDSFGSNTLLRQLHSAGYATKGGISKSLTDHDDDRLKSFPRFTSSFVYRGVNYPYTMVGFPPKSGRMEEALYQSGSVAGVHEAPHFTCNLRPAR